MSRDKFEEVLVDGTMYMEGFIALLAEILKSVAAEKDAWVSVHGSFFWAEWIIHFLVFSSFLVFLGFLLGGFSGFFKAPHTQGWPRDPRKRFEKNYFLMFYNFFILTL